MLALEGALAAVIALHMPVAPHKADVEKRSAYLAHAVALASGDNLEAAAAMVVNLRAESGGLEVYEKCLLVEKGGWGSFGIASLWEARYPGSTCGPIEVQAKAAFRILAWGKYSPAETFGHYIGATASGRHPEAQRRASEQMTIAWELEHLACL
jgi:hypothetical protein